MKIKPCVPSDWNNFEAKFRWQNAVYNIKYEKNTKQNQEYSENNMEMILDGKNVEEIKLNKNGSYNVIVKF